MHTNICTQKSLQSQETLHNTLKDKPNSIDNNSHEQIKIKQNLQNIYKKNNKEFYLKN